MSTDRRVIGWFSCGDASAVACALALKKYRATHLVVIARILIEGEHHDNDRFANDWARWQKFPTHSLRSDEFKSPWEVWEKRRYIAGIAGAPCTGALKKEVRFAYQRPTDIHVFGYTADANDRKRAANLTEANHELYLEFPLIEAGLGKADCHAIVRAAGINLPAMYLLGFDNNNCIGCPKGGAGYWNKIRRHFPEQFERMSKLSRELGARLVKQDGERIFLDQLRPETGRQKDEVTIECSPFCAVPAANLEVKP